MRNRTKTALLGLTLLAATTLTADRWIASTALPDLTPETSVTMLDRDDALLRAYQVGTGLWRLPLDPDAVDPRYLDLLMAYEDKRFADHGGVDTIAMGRAVLSSLGAGRIVSGGSTLTMQVARLLEDAPTRSFRAKLRQVRLALALERRLDKREILTLYLALAPFGGNIEGIRAASLSWFGKEPRRLTTAEAALLVALPQSPEGRRPDRHSARARAARDRVLDRAVAAKALDPDEAAAARREAVPVRRLAFPQFAPHLADRMRADRPETRIHRLTLDRDLQEQLETLLRSRARTLGPAISAAMIVADHATGEVIASIGSSDLFDARRRGYVDMTRAIRSPGSTLKPLIFGIAFEQGLAHPETLIDDRPMAFDRYAPTNFDRQYYGTVSIRKALHLSLNIPAVAALEAVGPARLIARMRRAGVRPVLPPGDVPGLAIALGGLGTSLHDLVTLYAALGRGGQAVALHTRAGEGAATDALPVLTPEAAWQIGDILAGAPAPTGAAQDTLAFKTGTSYGHRDAWAVGFDGRHVVGLWFGRPDGAPSPGILGLGTAAPVLFEAFGRLKSAPDPLPPAPAATLRLPQADLPRPLQRFRSRTRPVAVESIGPAITFPPDGATLAVEAGDPVALKVRDGTAPFTWLIDGAPLPADPHARQVTMEPDGRGFVSISVIDATGKAARARIRLQ